MKNLTIGTRLSLGFGVLLALIVVIAGLGLFRLSEVADATDDMVKNTLAKERAVSEWARISAGSMPKLLAIAKISNGLESAYFQTSLAEDTAIVSEIQARVEGMIALPRATELYAEIVQARGKMLEYVDQIQLMKVRGDFDGTKRLVDGELIPAMDAYEASLAALVNFQRDVLTQTAAEVASVHHAGRLALSGLAALALLIGLVLAWRLTVGITRPLRHAVDIAEAVAHGDLATVIEVNSSDETGQLMKALKEMNTGLAAMVTDIRDSSANIATGSGQISMGNADLSQRTEQQAANITQTAAAMEELSSTVNSNADVARQAAQMAAHASAAATEHSETVANVVTTMEEINTSSGKIANIIGVIDMIAFQTNILALNAAVEAARAGEQGRGFAVVASEVRSLAQKSAQAAKDITQLINESVQRTNAGSEIAAAAGHAMVDIVKQVQNVTALINDISAATTEQTTGLSQISEAVVQLSDVTQQNAALVEESAAAAESLDGQARRLVGMVGRFQLGSSDVPLLAA